MDFTDANEKLIQTATAVGVGFLAWEKESTATDQEYAKSRGIEYSLFGKRCFANTIAHTFGSKVAESLCGKEWAYPNSFHPNPTGFLNKTFLSGVGLAVLDRLLGEVKEYKNLPAISSIVKGAAWGLAIGGAIGGIFDPPVIAGFTATSNLGQNRAAIGNVPFSRGEAGQRASFSVLA